MAERSDGGPAGAVGGPPVEPEFEPLRWIGAYKLFKALLALVGALLVLRLLHRDLPAATLKWLGKLHVDPHSELGEFVLRQVLDIHRRGLGWMAAGLFVYVPLAVAEGVGLILRRLWAEWLTVVTTALLVPLEIHGLFRRPTTVRGLILALNIAVIIYLAARIQRDQGEPDQRQARS